MRILRRIVVAITLRRLASAKYARLRNMASKINLTGASVIAPRPVVLQPLDG